MALDQTLYRKLLHGGMPNDVALLVADPDKDAVAAPAVANPAVISATAAALTDAATKADVTALRNTVDALIVSLRAGGVIAP